jgi:conjugative transfer signal peptidase TraF
MSSLFHRFAPALAEDSAFHAMSPYFTDSRRRGLSMLVALASTITVIVAVFWVLRLRIALTDSACPPGIYRMVNHSISRGDLVIACLPPALARFAQARGYLARGRGCGDGIEPVGKRIGALPGDTVEVTRDYIAINGHRLEHSATVSRDSRGRSLTQVTPGRYTVRPDHVWLLGTTDARSWDSRYFGPVPIGSVRAQLDPLVTW